MKILVSDDQIDVLEAIRLLLKGAGHQTEIVESPKAALAAQERGLFDLVLMDMNYSRDTTSGDEGLDLLDSLLKRDGSVPIIVMTAWSSVDLAVEAMRRGAVDFIQKPWDNARLLAVLRTQVELAKALRRGQGLRGLVDHLVVEADHRVVGLRDDQVLVVARVGDQRLLRGLDAALADAREVVERLGRHALGRDRRTRQQVHAVGGVELRGPGVAGAVAVERVEVEPR